MRTPSMYLQLALLATLATHFVADGAQPEIGEATSMYFAGPDGYALSDVMPSHLSVFVFMKASKQRCAEECDKETKCKGFKSGGGGCSLMGPEESAPPPPPPRVAPLPAQTTEDAKVMAGKPVPFVTAKKAAMATVYLASMAGKENNDQLKHIMEAAKAREEKIKEEGLHSASRNPLHVEKRGSKQMLRMKKYEIQVSMMQAAQTALPKRTKELIYKKLKDLPSNTEAGSQQHIANEMIRHEWRHFMQGFGRGARNAVKKTEEEVKTEVRQLIKDEGADAAALVLNKKEKQSELKWKKVGQWRMSPESLGPEALVSTTASEFADNLSKCPSLKAMCKVDIRTVRQCPHTCHFVKELNKKKFEKSIHDKKVLIKRRDDTAQDMKQQREAIDERLEVVEKENAQQKEKEVKMRELKSELKEKLKDRPEKTVVQVAPDPAVEKQKKRDIKAQALRKLAKKLQTVGSRKVRQGQQFLKNTRKDVQKQENATRVAQITSPIQVIDKASGKPVTVEPDVSGNLEKASEESPKIANSLQTAINLVKSGEADLQKSKMLLRQAVATSEGKPLPQPARKPVAMLPVKQGIPVNQDRITVLRRKMQALEAKLKLLPDGSAERKPVVDKIAELKRQIKAEYKPMPSNIAEPKDFKDVSGAGRKAVEGGPGNKGDGPYDKDKEKAKEMEKKGKDALAGKKDAGVEAAEERVKRAMKAGKGRGHSAWSPKLTKGKGKRARRGKRKRKPVGIKMGVFAESDTKLGDSVGQLHRSLTTPEKFINFDGERCNYNPPAGCGCDGSMLTQQTEPNNELNIRIGEGGEVAQLGTEGADPVSTNDCPQMPADCTCRTTGPTSAKDYTALSLVQILADTDEDVEDSDEELDNLFSGIICRIRTAVTVAKAKQPRLLAALKKKKAYVDNKKQLVPLLACVKDTRRSDADCTQYLMGLMGSMDKVGPEVKVIQKKLGLEYQKAVKQCA